MRAFARRACSRAEREGLASAQLHPARALLVHGGALYEGRHVEVRRSPGDHIEGRFADMLAALPVIRELIISIST